MILCKLRMIGLIYCICRLISAIYKTTLSKWCLSALIPIILVCWIWGPPVLEMEVILDLYLVVGINIVTIIRTLAWLIFLIEADPTLLEANWGLKALWWANCILVESIRWLIIMVTIRNCLSLKQILAHHWENIAHVAAICCVASITQWW